MEQRPYSHLVVKCFSSFVGAENFISLRFDIVIVVTLRTTVFHSVTFCSMVKYYWCLLGLWSVFPLTLDSTFLSTFCFFRKYEVLRKNS